jgi:hypothetical protein
MLPSPEKQTTVRPGNAIAAPIATDANVRRFDPVSSERSMPYGINAGILFLKST